VATTASNLGDGLTLVAMPLLAAAFTRDPLTIAGIGVFTPLAKITVALWGGVLVDRSDRRRVMLVADVVRMVVMAGFAALVAMDEVSFAFVYAAVFVLGVGEFLFDTSATAVVRDVVPSGRLTTANGWLFAAEDGAQDLAAPSVGAGLFALVAWLPFLVDASSFALSALLVLSLRGQFRAARDGSPVGVRAELREGFRFTFSRPFFRTAAVMWSVLGFTLGLTIATLVLFALETLDSGELGFAVLITAGAAGIVAGNLVTDRLERRIRPSGVFVSAIVGGGIALAATGAAPVLVVASVAQAVWGIGFALANTQMVSVRQRLVPDVLLGRITGVFALLSAVGMVVGAVLGGVLTDAGGPRVPILVAGVVQVGAGLAWAALLHLHAGVEAGSRPNGHPNET
jgi:MFS family permease